MVPCRCEVLNHLTGAPAADYARTHLDSLGATGVGRLWACPDTGVRWTDETPTASAGHVDRLRRKR